MSNDEVRKIKEKHEGKEKEVEQIVLYQNIMSVIFVILLILLLIGSYRYYLRQYKDHKRQWSWSVFWMGSNKCAS